MKQLLKVTTIAAAVALAVGCGKKEEAVAETPVQEAPAAEASTAEATVTLTEEQKTAYAIGQSIGAHLSGMLEGQKELKMDLEIDHEILKQGFGDALAGNAQLTEEEMYQVLQDYDKSLQEQANKLAEEEKQAALVAGQEFLEENAKREEVQVTESGLQYEVLQEGEGEKPAAVDTVTVHYAGTLIDGTEFDSSIARGEPISFPLNQVIPGWTEGLQLMSPGSKYKLYIPSELGYGEQPVGSIPANSTLIFEVELFEVEKAEAPEPVQLPEETTEEAATE